jgi:hypothetical protein
MASGKEASQARPENVEDVLWMPPIQSIPTEKKSGIRH